MELIQIIFTLYGLFGGTVGFYIAYKLHKEDKEHHKELFENP